VGSSVLDAIKSGVSRTIVLTAAAPLLSSPREHSGQSARARYGK
jgi:hypothetical protein